MVYVPAGPDLELRTEVRVRDQESVALGQEG
jgi:hypothetical protein